MVFTGGLVYRGVKLALQVGVAIAVAAAGLSASALAADESQPITPSAAPDLSRPPWGQEPGRPWWGPSVHPCLWAPA